MRAAPGQRQHQRQRRRDHCRRAEDVELMPAIVARQFTQRAVGGCQRDDAERHIDPENQRPVQMVSEQTAEHRTERARSHEHDRRVALDDWPLARAQQIGDDGLRDWQQPAAADALQAARQDQKPDRGRERTGDRTDDEDSDRRKHDGAAAIDVGELAK